MEVEQKMLAANTQRSVRQNGNPDPSRSREASADGSAAVVLEVEHLSKTFGDFQAVDNLSFSVSEGEFIGIIGPNGAGKTTTIYMLLGLITPSAGDVRIFGRRLVENREHILQRTSFASPYISFPPRLTVAENLTIFARLYGVHDKSSQISKLLKMFEIENLRDKPVSRLSSGENTRLGLCKAMINNPRLLLLDEPTAFLDPQAALNVKGVLLDLQRISRTTIIYTSHNLADVEAMCQRLIFLSHGRMIAAGSPIEVTQEILREDRSEPALAEAFLRIAKGEPNEAV
jgi:ABC-2 type transport system ATP-binding protein